MAFNYRLQYREARSPNNCTACLHRYPRRPRGRPAATPFDDDSTPLQLALRLSLFRFLSPPSFVIISSGALRTIECSRIIEGFRVLSIFFFLLLSSFFLSFSFPFSRPSFFSALSSLFFFFASRLFGG